MTPLGFLFFVYFLFLMSGKFWDRFIFARVSEVAARGLPPRGAPRSTVRGWASPCQLAIFEHVKKSG
jgi:hypothetical protein